jgi:AcrR family transcriptional regulator
MRAKVSQRTLYNAFNNKDRLVALSIREAYDEYQRFITYKTGPATVAGIVERTLSTNRRNLKIKNYTKAIVTIYFSPTTPADIWYTIQEMAIVGWKETLPALRKTGILRSWVDVESFSAQIGNLQYSVINDWCQGRLSDQEYLFSILTATLTFFMGAVSGPYHEEAASILEMMHKTGTLPLMFSELSKTLESRPTKVRSKNLL